ncbi:GDYXXLXY domain-containing protein [Pseudochrobactrum sp. HB0163]|uniref:GDYXXLXY domain-containing protein n=1 Tax=Pseudochrobactrum sp. HB0163 TaxID=3450708 RepID=UPI003F6E18F8
MSSLTKKQLLIAAVIAALLQTGVMLAGVLQRINILRNGTEVVLRSLPVDPRDLMRGDYVTLSYDISRIPVNMIRGEPPHKSGLNYLYVILAKEPDDSWKLQRAQFTMPDRTEKNEIILRGEIEAPIQAYDENSRIPVVYGIERYYVPEGEGLALEQAQTEGTVDIVLSVNDKGIAAIRSVLVNGKPFYKEPLF